MPAVPAIGSRYSGPLQAKGLLADVPSFNSYWQVLRHAVQSA